ncbi:hypothetical protein SNQ36_004200 [Cronobacter sakazakii]|nr:hypothetical protein [Cronobacter sakazakii]
MKRLASCALLITMLAGCNDSDQVNDHDNSANAIEIFKVKMGEENNIAPFTYSGLVFHPDENNSATTTSGWVCGDAKMTHSGGTFEFKVRGHVLQTGNIKQVGDLAALPAGSEIEANDALYNRHCK